jgi:hypothetical protein
VTAVAAPGRGYQLQVGSPDALAVSVVMFPQQSMLALLRQVAAGQPNGGPGWPPAPISRALRPAARFAARSFTSRCSPVIPECCAPIPPLADVAVTAQADRLRDLSPDVLTDELQTGSDSHAFPRQWQAAAEQPRRWLASLADASLDAWAAMQPRWRAAAPLLDREVARVGTAAVRGGMEALLNSLHPRISYTDGVLAVSFPHDWRVDLGGRRLALMPMIANRGALAVSFERPGVCYIGYPIRPPAPGAGSGQRDAGTDPRPAARRRTAGASPSAHRERTGRCHPVRTHHRHLPPPATSHRGPGHPRQARNKRPGQPHHPRRQADRPALRLIPP